VGPGTIRNEAVNEAGSSAMVIAKVSLSFTLAVGLRFEFSVLGGRVMFVRTQLKHIVSITKMPFIQRNYYQHTNKQSCVVTQFKLKVHKNTVDCSLFNTPPQSSVFSSTFCDESPQQT